MATHLEKLLALFILQFETLENMQWHMSNLLLGSNMGPLLLHFCGYCLQKKGTCSWNIVQLTRLPFVCKRKLALIWCRNSILLLMSEIACISISRSCSHFRPIHTAIGSDLDRMHIAGTGFIHFWSRPHYNFAKWIGTTKCGRVLVISRDKNVMWTCPWQFLWR